MQEYFTSRRPDVVPAVLVDTFQMASHPITASGLARSAGAVESAQAEALLQHTPPATPAQPPRAQPQSRKRSTPVEILRSMNTRGERFLEIEAERSAAMAKYVSSLGTTKRELKSKDDYEMAARAFLVELQYSEGLSAEDIELLDQAEQCLFSHSSFVRDRLITVLVVLQSKHTAPEVVLNDLRKRFVSHWSVERCETSTSTQGASVEGTML